MDTSRLVAESKLAKRALFKMNSRLDYVEHKSQREFANLPQGYRESLEGLKALAAIKSFELARMSVCHAITELEKTEFWDR